MGLSSLEDYSLPMFFRLIGYRWGAAEQLPPLFRFLWGSVKMQPFFTRIKMIKRVVVAMRVLSGVVLMVILGAFAATHGESQKSKKKERKMSLLPAIVMETKENPDATVIWLHGLGADGNDFAPIVPELQLPDDMAIRFIFPHAPSIPVTVNGGFVMPAWYDILEMEIDRKVDTSQLLLSAEAIDNFVHHQIEQGINSERIIIAGFSQGGAVAYQVVLSSDVPLGGLLAMSTYFATSEEIELSEQNRDVEIEVHHGLLDPVVPERLGQHAVKHLSDEGYEVDYRTYSMEHSVCPQQINDISAWLQQRLR